MVKIAIICGGPSLERGISLNSARSLLDHLPPDIFEIFPLYIDQKKQCYCISPHQLYSNTPEDFDFKLKQVGSPVDLVTYCKTVDLVFPVIHGPFGEDGQLQSLLETHGIPFVGSGSQTCRTIFLKHLANEKLLEMGYPVLPYSVVTEKTPLPLIEGRTIIKPSSGGSSIGVYSVQSSSEAAEKIQSLLQLFEDKHVIVEPFCKGKEFTIVVLQSPEKGILALTPTEIETSYENDQILDFRKKYLPTNSTFYHTPPRFGKEIIEAIKAQAIDLFHRLQMRDFVRMDGWVMEDGSLYFSDFNPISGLEQNSFLFRQASFDGLTHEEILSSIVENACKRESIPFPKKKPPRAITKQKVFILLGGSNAERQVSLMSGTNVWLKLLRSNRFEPVPFFLDLNESIWEIPYHLMLNHTVEEIHCHCASNPPSSPMELPNFIEKAKEEKAFVFIALHGGKGENGQLQDLFEKEGVPYNGSDSSASFVCIDKWLTGEKIRQAKDPSILSLPKKILCLKTYSWQEITSELQSQKVIIKPKADGCSAGIAMLGSHQDLETYIRFVKEKKSAIPPFTFPLQSNPIEMPSSAIEEFLIEPYIQTDRITVQNHGLVLTPSTGWIELTVGVLERKGVYSSLLPSITIAKSGILTLEEKFQGGTGINITPPPESILSPPMIRVIQQHIEKIAALLEIRNYARIDIFFHRLLGKTIVIEANTLPGLTPSTVLYHQALAQNPPLPPRQFLEHLIENALDSHFLVEL